VKSAGNDIVALKIIDKQRSNHPAFYSKFILQTEQALYELPDLPFENFVWLLWSVKEAAYKYLQCHDHELIFSPSKIIVQNIQPVNGFEGTQWVSPQPVKYYAGIVVHGDNSLYYRTIIHDKYIITIVNDEDSFANVYWGVKRIDQTDSKSQSAGVRAFTLSKLKSFFPDAALSIKKSPAGYPVLFSNDIPADVPISFAHHDHYVTYSFRIDDGLNAK
jgi:phosphopantetheinyl transferase (holo-ACP synthase)